MTDDQIKQSLKLTIQELVSKLSDELTAKHLLAIQLVAKEEELGQLGQEKEELLALLDSQTNPEKGEDDDGIITA